MGENERPPAAASSGTVATTAAVAGKGYGFTRGIVKKMKIASHRIANRWYQPPPIPATPASDRPPGKGIVHVIYPGLWIETRGQGGAGGLRAGDPFVVQNEGPASIPMSVPGDSREQSAGLAPFVLSFSLSFLFLFPAHVVHRQTLRLRSWNSTNPTGPEEGALSRVSLPQMDF